MKLYLVEDPDGGSCDTYAGFVCRAIDEQTAREMCPVQSYIYRNGVWYFQYYDGTEKEEKRYDGWPSDVNELKVTLLGEAISDEQGVVLAYC